MGEGQQQLLIKLVISEVKSHTIIMLISNNVILNKTFVEHLNLKCFIKIKIKNKKIKCFISSLLFFYNLDKVCISLATREEIYISYLGHR